MWLIKVVLVTLFILIFWQDFKDRLVYWFLYPLVGALAYILQVYHVDYLPALANAATNILIITIVISVSFIYAVFIINKKFLNETMGLGDVLLMFFLSFTFATITFIVLFVFSLLFSLALHLYLKNTSEYKTVPLAGYISLFFAAVYIRFIFH
jgi:hypothetical protein